MLPDQLRRLLALLLIALLPAIALASPGAVVGESGTNHSVLAIYVGESGTNHTVLTCYVGTSGGNKTCFSALTASVSPTSVSYVGPHGTGRTTGNTTCSATGGSGTYTYAWSVTNLSGGTFTAVSPSAATTDFSANLGSGGTITGNGVCTVTDTVTTATATATVSVSFSSTD